VKRKFLFSRTYEVELDVIDTSPDAEELAEDTARWLIIDHDDAVSVGQLTFEGTDDPDE
jgi:hypothetical protein